MTRTRNDSSLDDYSRENRSQNSSGNQAQDAYTNLAHLVELQGIETRGIYQLNWSH